MQPLNLTLHDIHSIIESMNMNTNGTIHAPTTPSGTLPGHKGFVNIAATDARLCNHPDRPAAVKEAERLARETRQPIVVYAPLIVVSPPELLPCQKKVVNHNVFSVVDRPPDHDTPF